MRLEQLLLEDRLDYIAQQMATKLVTKAKQDMGQDMDAPTILKQLVQSDPTPNKQYAQWLAKQYVSNQFTSNQLDQVKAVLGEFDRVKSQLPNKDLNAYKTLGDVTKAVEPFAGQEIQTGKAKQRASKDASYQDTTVLHKGADFTLLIPKNEEAAKYFGKGTTWCTSATNDNKFAEYASAGNPLIILLGPHGDKIQMQFPASTDGKTMKDFEGYTHLMRDKDYGTAAMDYSGLPQIVDSGDEGIPISAVFKKYPALEGILVKSSNYAYWSNTNTNPIVRMWRKWNIDVGGDQKVGAYAAPSKAESEAELAKMIAEKDYPPTWVEYMIAHKMPRLSVVEQAILSSKSDQAPGMAVLYAEKVIKDRWPEGEPLIHTMIDAEIDYAAAFNTRDPKLEERIIKEGTPRDVYVYSTKVLKQRWPAAEQLIAKDSYWLRTYNQVFADN